MKRLTIGCRVKLNPKVKSTWDWLNGHDLLLTERLGKEFAAIVLKKGVSMGLTEKPGMIIDNEVAWLSENELVLINADFDTNLNFIDWYQEHQADECPDCVEFGEENVKICSKCGYKFY